MNNAGPKLGLNIEIGDLSLFFENKWSATTSKLPRHGNVLTRNNIKAYVTRSETSSVVYKKRRFWGAHVFISTYSSLNPSER